MARTCNEARIHRQRAPDSARAGRRAGAGAWEADAPRASKTSAAATTHRFWATIKTIAALNAAALNRAARPRLLFGVKPESPPWTGDRYRHCGIDRHVAV